MSLCTDALRWDSSGVGVGVGVRVGVGVGVRVGVGVGVHPNFNVGLFSETINHRILELDLMVVCSEGFPNVHSLITSRKGKGS